MQLEHTAPVASSYTSTSQDPTLARNAAAAEECRPTGCADEKKRTPIDLRRFTLQPQQALFRPHGALAGVDRRDALVGGAMLAGSLVARAAMLLCPALSWWALAGLAGGGAGVMAAVQSGVAHRARRTSSRDLTPWPLTAQRNAMLETVRALHTRRPGNALRADLFERLRRQQHKAQEYDAFLRTLGPLGDASDTHALLKYMRWHTLLDARRIYSQAPPLPTEAQAQAEADDPSMTAECAIRAYTLHKELERLAHGNVTDLLYTADGQQAWAEARLAFVLHRGLLPRLLTDCPAVQAHPEWFRMDESMRLRMRHVAEFVTYWKTTPALDNRFFEVALNPACL